MAENPVSMAQEIRYSRGYETWGQNIVTWGKRASWQSALAAIESISKPLPSLDFDPLAYRNGHIDTIPELSFDSERVTSTGDLEKRPPLLKRLTSRTLTWTQGTVEQFQIRSWCIAVLVVSWLVSLTLLALGITIVVHLQPLPEYLKNKMIISNVSALCFISVLEEYQIWHFTMEATAGSVYVAPLLANLVVTALLDGHTRIHGTALRWLLFHQDKRPEYNTHSRFFRSTKKFGPCHWSMNILAAVSMCLAYGSTSLLMVGYPVVAVCNDSYEATSYEFDGPRHGIDVSGFAMIFLGFALLTQNVLSTWILLGNQKLIRSWSVNPIVNAKLMSNDHVQRSDCPVTFRHRIETNSISGRASAHRQVREVRIFSRGLWALFALSVVAVIVIVVRAKQTGNLNIVDINTVEVDRDVSYVWQMFGLVFVLLGTTDIISDWACVFMLSALQGVLTVGLHCADVLINFHNDEVCWQDAYKCFVENPDAETIEPKERIVKWRTVLVLTIKSVAQWVFGFTISIHILFAVSLIPFVVLSAILLLLAGVMEIMNRLAPKGDGPTTYGNLYLLELSMAYEEKRKRVGGSWI